MPLLSELILEVFIPSFRNCLLILDDVANTYGK